MLFVSGIFYVGAQNRQSKPSVTAAQAVACINAAVAARAGTVESLDTDREGGRLVCEVEIIADDGRNYNVFIDPADNKVIRNVEDR